MPRECELSTVLSRSEPLDFLRAHAEAAGCEIGVFDLSGAPLAAEGAMATLTPSRDGETVLVPGAGEGCVVEVFDRVVGYVVATGCNGSAAAAPGVAARGAQFLTELCVREYELNDLSREILSAYEELNLFYDLTSKLAGAPDAAAICSVVLDMAVRAARARQGWILLSPDGGAMRVVAAQGVDVDAAARQVRGGIAGRVLASRTGDLTDHPERLDPSEVAPLEALAVTSLITVPISVPGGEGRSAMGVLQLADKAPARGRAAAAVAEEDPGGFTAQDLKLAQALASQGAILMENSRLVAYERELRIARDIQQSLLPPAPPGTSGLDVAGACVVASNVGGDYYDHVEIDENRLGVLLTDVSGHNLAAALMQTAARSTFRAAMFSSPSPLGVLDSSNRTLFDDLSRAELFLTAWVGVVDARTGRLAFGDAGHNPALLHRAATGEAEWLSSGGVPIGVLRDGLYRQSEVTIEPGDVLVVYTDGVTEARPGGPGSEEYGEPRLAEIVKRHAASPSNEILRQILTDVAAHAGAGARGDDTTLVVLKLRDGESR